MQTETSMGVTPTSRTSRKLYIIAVVFALVLVTSVVYAITPTPEEVIQNELEALGESWDSWNDIEAQEHLNASEATERANRANEEKVKVEDRAKALRLFFQSESL